MDWSRFQLVALVAAAILLAVRAASLWLTIRVNPFKASHPAEVCFALGEVVFAILIFRSVQLLNIPLPAVADIRILNSETVQRVGAILVGAGVLIFALSLISLGNSWRIGIDRKTPGALVTTGLFRFSRNPIFVFMDLYLTGTFLLNGTCVFLVVAVIGVAILHFQILREESFLSERYGEPYRAYRGRTPRYL